MLKIRREGWRSVGAFVWLLSSTALGVGEDAPSHLSLSGLLSEVARKSISATNAGLDLSVAREGTRQIRSMYYPTVSFDTSHTNLDNAPFLEFGPNSFPAGEQAFWKFSISAREVLWDFGRRKKAVLASEGRETRVEAEGADAVRRAQLEALVAYMDARTLLARRAVVEQRVGALKEHHRVAQDLFDHGVVAANDLLRTEVSLRNIEDQGADLDNKVVLAQQSLNVLIGREPGALVSLPVELQAPPDLGADLAACKSGAKQNNSGLKALAARLAAEERSLDFLKVDFYPTFAVQAFHSYDQNRYLRYPNVNGFSFGMSWNLYDGGARASKVREARLAAEKTRSTLRDVASKVEIQVEQAWRDLEQARREGATAAENEKAAVENLRILEDQYKEGLVRTTDVLDAESLLAESRFALAAAGFRAYQKQGMLLALMGEDLPAFYADAGE